MVVVMGQSRLSNGRTPLGHGCGGGGGDGAAKPVTRSGETGGHTKMAAAHGRSEDSGGRLMTGKGRSGPEGGQERGGSGSEHT
ncbi:unnamed protein product [Heligmosomoides polygyrus]|uniref:Uncharacterized protein n=1 Tax=Heligmosomoides polygyrus TaxID=6339 RepID=A0A183FPZ0_HELPZ|nr:unnamed protein product [Heligmosomoides polygyrus]